MKRTALTNVSKAYRSRVTNGTAVLIGVPGNSAQARRYRDLIADLTSEAGGELTESERLQIRNAATLQLHAEDLTARLVRGEDVDAETITRAANGATRALAAIKRNRSASKRARRGPAAHPFLEAAE